MPKKVTKKAGAPAKSAKQKPEEKKKPVEIKDEPLEPKELGLEDEEKEKSGEDISPDALEGALEDSDDSYEADMDSDESSDWE